MSTCPHCGGLLGRDCFNPQECGEIAHAEQMRIEHERDNLAGCVDSRDERIRALEAGLGRCVAELKARDSRTPWQESEPQWWLHMMQTIRDSESLLAGQEGGK